MNGKGNNSEGNTAQKALHLWILSILPTAPGASFSAHEEDILLFRHRRRRHRRHRPLYHRRHRPPHHRLSPGDGVVSRVPGRSITLALMLGIILTHSAQGKSLSAFVSSLLRVGKGWS